MCSRVLHYNMQVASFYIYPVNILQHWTSSINIRLNLQSDFWTFSFSSNIYLFKFIYRLTIVELIFLFLPVISNLAKLTLCILIYLSNHYKSLSLYIFKTYRSFKLYAAYYIWFETGMAIACMGVCWLRQWGPQLQVLLIQSLFGKYQVAKFH